MDYNGGVVTSPDGVTWTDQSSVAVGYVYSGMIWIGDKFVICDSSGVWTSPTGAVWTNERNLADEEWFRIFATFGGASSLSWDGEHVWIGVYGYTYGEQGSYLSHLLWDPVSGHFSPGIVGQGGNPQYDAYYNTYGICCAP
jgi:hypothetical protein